MNNSRKTNKKLALFLIFGPITMILVSIIVYAIANFVIGGSVSYSGDSGSDQPAIMTVINVVLFLVSAIGLLALIPCFIIGIILVHRQNHPIESSPAKPDPETRSWEDLE